MMKAMRTARAVILFITILAGEVLKRCADNPRRSNDDAGGECAQNHNSDSVRSKGHGRFPNRLSSMSAQMRPRALEGGAEGVRVTLCCMLK